jgi:UDP-N-acetylmuramoyl-tripeptide--D-alanyl-D-alanine ligase
MWRLDDVLKAVHGTLLRVEREEFTSISTDSRSIREGELFVPLIGPNFDGHVFVANAYIMSGGGSLCQKGREAACESAGGTIILVDDTTQALLDLARHKRKQLGGRFIAITGSNGKTTTKELLVHAMSGFASVAYNERNYNNNIGVSQTILGVTGQPDYCIFELGTNHPGEIAQLAELVEPDISTITNIHASHLEGLGDIAGVFREKVTLFDHTKAGGAILINIDDPALRTAVEKPVRRAYTYAIELRADFMLSVEKVKGLGGFDLELFLRGERVRTTTRLLGIHNLFNIVAAVSIGHVCGVSKEMIRERVATFEPYPGRFKAMTSRKGYIIIDDAYNANPSSMEWAIGTLEQLPCKGKKIAILGDMKELGEKDAYYHRELGRLLKRSTLSTILFFGEAAKVAYDEMDNGRAKFFDDKRALIAYAAGMARQDDLILVKGSRAMSMNEVVEELL